MQEGTPSPENPVEIQSVGDLVTEGEHAGKYKIPVEVHGKNILNIDDFVTTYNLYKASEYKTAFVTFDGKDCIKIYGQLYTDGQNVKYMEDSFAEGKQYTISFDYYDIKVNNAVGVIIIATYTDGTSSVAFTPTRNTSEAWTRFTWTSSNKKTIKYLKISYGTGTAFTYISGWQIEEGATATSYEPCSRGIYNIYADAPLLKAGDYADYVDFKNQRIVRNVEVLDDTGTKSIEESLVGLLSPTYEPIEVPAITVPKSSIAYISEGTSVKGSMEVQYYQDINEKLSDLYEKTVKEYGVRWYGTSDTKCVRLGDAVGLVANAHKGSTAAVDNDFNRIYPWSDIRLCNVNASGNILAYIGEPSFKRDGSNGDVMVEIPKFYYKRVKTGSIEEWWICEEKLPGYELHPLFIDDGVEVSKVYHSAYNAATFTDSADGKIKLRSVSGDHLTKRTTRANFRTYARNKGSGWGIEDLSCLHALQMLYLIEYADTNSQDMLGFGASNLAYNQNYKAIQATENGNSIVIAYQYNSIFKAGQSIEIGSALGANDITDAPRIVTAVTSSSTAGTCTISFDGAAVSIPVNSVIWNAPPVNGSCDTLNGESGYIGSNRYADVSYRGIEGIHAKIYRCIDGININNYVAYYANSMADYADDVYSGKYKAVGYTNPQTNGNISAFGYDKTAPWVMCPVTLGGSSTTYIPDTYSRNSGNRTVSAGGTFFSSDGAGIFCFNGNSGSADAGINNGAHLLMKKR